MLHLSRALRRPLLLQLQQSAMHSPFLSSLSTPEFRVENLTGGDAGILVLAMNRPQARNAISRSLLDAFYAALDAIPHDRESRVIILRSDVPGIFCAGADLKERATMKPEEVGPFVSRARALMARLEHVPQPVIAALDGHALGGGFEMALAADLRVAADNAKLGLPETKLAIIPGAGGTQRLTRLVGLAKAKELIFTGRAFSGEEAVSMGAVNASVPQVQSGDAAYCRSLDFAREMLACGPVALRAAKIAINRGAECDLTTALAVEELCYGMVIPTKDRIEGLTAFKEKRTPVYRGF